MGSEMADDLATEFGSLRAEPTNAEEIRALIWMVYDAVQAGDATRADAARRDAETALDRARVEVGRGETWPAIVREPWRDDPGVGCLRRVAAS